MVIHRRRRYHLPTRGEKILRETSGLYRQYLYYCYKLGAFPKYTRSPWKVPVRMRSDLQHLKFLQKEVHLLAENRIGTMDELILYKEKLQVRMELLVTERKDIAQKARRKNPIDVQMALTDRRKELTAQIAAFREQIRLAEDIEKRTESRMEHLRKAERKEGKNGDVRQ
jgi:GTP cyclohydrolase III